MRVSIITAVFNNCATIASALDSVLSQSYDDIEMIVIDGASTDGTREVLARYESRIAVLVSERDAGIYDALNTGISRATGDVIGFLHADDLLADSDALARIAAAMADTSIDAVYGDLVYVRKDDPSRVLRTWNAGGYVPEKLNRGWMPPHPTLYARRSIYERLGNFDTSFRIAADYDCMLRFLNAGIRVSYIPHLQVRMRVGGASNRSLANIVRKSREDFRALRKNEIGAVLALVCKNFRKLQQFSFRSDEKRCNREQK